MIRFIVSLFLAACAAIPASAQTWPAKPVRVVNTFAPGGTADMLARLVADTRRPHHAAHEHG